VNRWKGFSLSTLEAAFGVERTPEGYAVPYYLADGQPYRTKLFRDSGGRAVWLGEPKPQIPYGLETLSLGGQRMILTEGESCAWALRLAFPEIPALGLPGASSWQRDWGRFFAQYPVIYLSVDGDKAGASLTDKVWPDIPWARRVRMFKGLDTRDVLQRYGSHVYRAMLADADWGHQLDAFFTQVAREGVRDAA
jgi:DNA primase